MRRGEIRVGVLRIEGTNSEKETASSFRRIGVQADLVHMNEFDPQRVRNARSLLDYHALVLPGGFSAGDYVRAGALWAARLSAKHSKEIETFLGEGRVILGICNGFQVLVEMGLLPGRLPGIGEVRGVLHINDSNRYECRPVLVERVGSSPLVSSIPRSRKLTLIASHGEGKLLFPREKMKKILAILGEEGQIAFRYTTPKGEEATYPWNPNGSPMGVAALSNPEGNVLGIMPHPERVFDRVQHPDWTRNGRRDAEGRGDGYAIFEGIVKYLERRL